MKGQLVFTFPLVAFDNSSLSLTMLDVVDAMATGFEKVMVVNAFYPYKSYIPKQMRGQWIKQTLHKRYQGDKKFQVQSKAIGEKTTDQILLESLVQSGSTILFLGFVGGKGWKPRNRDLSSRVRQFLFNSKHHLALIKRPLINTHKVVFCCDGSDISYEGLSFAIAFAVKFNYSLKVIYAYEQFHKGFAKSVKLHFKSVQEQHKTCVIETVLYQGQLIQALKQQQDKVDWIIFNKNGMRGSIEQRKTVGRCATEIVEDINCNLIIFSWL